MMIEDTEILELLNPETITKIQELVCPKYGSSNFIYYNEILNNN